MVSSEARPQETSADIMRIPVEMIEPNPFQPRMSFDTEALEELADSIRTLGLIQPITVRKKASDKNLKYPNETIQNGARDIAITFIGLILYPSIGIIWTAISTTYMVNMIFL